ncbi:MAG: DNA repair protein RecO [Coriobacteriia bacterium]|nr:DNA repair protein RecO [Coriobacteriia bacterium]
MSTYRLRALVLRKTRLGEADIILTLLSDDGRIVRAVAKGMRKPTSRFSGRLEPGSVADLMLASGRNLEIISDVRSVDLHTGLRAEYGRLTAASVVLDVLDKMAVEGQPEERLYGLACATLTALERAEDPSQKCVVTGFLLKAMAMHGYRPHLDSCVACASAAEGPTEFSLDAGGVLCPACGGSAPALSSGVRNLLTWLLASKMDDIARTELSSREMNEAFALMRQFVTYHLPARLKALEFYANGAAQ